MIYRCICFERVWDDYYFQQDSGYDDYKKDSYKKELFKFVPESKVTMEQFFKIS